MKSRASLIFLICMGGIAALFFFRSSLLSWMSDTLQNRLIRGWIADLNQKLPFVIEEASVSNGMRSLTFQARYRNHVRARLEGPIQVRRIKINGERKIEIKYTPVLWLETLDPLVRSSSLTLELTILAAEKIPTGLEILETVTFQAAPQPLSWKAFGLEVQDLSLTSRALRGFEQFEAGVLHARQLEYTATGRQGSLHAFELRVEPGAWLSGPEISGSVSLGSAEVLLQDQYYFDLPPGIFPLSFQVKKEPLSVRVSDQRTVEFEGNLSQARLKLKKRPWNDLKKSILEPLKTSTIPFLSEVLYQVERLQIQGGTLEAELHFKNGAPARAQASYLGGQLENLELPARVRGLDVRVAADLEPTLKLDASAVAKTAIFRRAHILFREPLQLGLRDGRVQIGKPGTPLPLSVPDLPLTIRSISGEKVKGEYVLTTAVQLAPMEFPKLSEIFCFGIPRPPPAVARVDFSEVELSPSFIDVTGEAQVELFGGKARAYDLGLFDLNTAVPELDFQFEMSGVRLEPLGEWMGFGEMDGTLELTVHDAVIQGWLPTQFDSRLEIKPDRRSKIVFSPDAMKNVVRLFAADGIDQLPGIADWLAFGWPSRIFGGYDVRYAGAEVISRNGILLLNTLDPKEIVEKEGRHYILYGPRFKMPLSVRKVPLVISAPSMGNFMRQVFLQLKGLAEQKALKENSREPISSPCELPPL